MKKYIFIAVALLAVSLAKADTEVLLDSIVTFNEEGVPTNKESYTYNETGVQTKFYKSKHGKASLP